MPRGTMAILGAASVVGWFAAALFIRATAPMGWYGGGQATLILYLSSAVIAVALTELLRRLMPGGTLVQAAAVLTGPALVLDGVALVWLPSLYGNEPAGPASGAAWLLFGVGAILLAALVRNSLGGER